MLGTRNKPETCLFAVALKAIGAKEENLKPKTNNLKQNIMKTNLKILSIPLLISVATFITSNAKADNQPPPPRHGETGKVSEGRCTN